MCSDQNVVFMNTYANRSTEFVQNEDNIKMYVEVRRQAVDYIYL